MFKIALAIYIMNIFDMICTLYLSDQYGSDIEGNPIGKILLKNKAITFVIKVLAMAGLLLLIYSLSTAIIFRIALYVLFGIYSLLTIYHIVILVYLKIHKL